MEAFRFIVRVEKVAGEVVCSAAKLPLAGPVLLGSAEAEFLGNWVVVFVFI